MLPKFHKPLIILNKMILIFSHMKWAWDFLLHQSFYHSSSDPNAIPDIEPYTVTRRSTTCKTGSNECTVCLCSIGEGEEIRELKCGHVFHRGCFDRWVGYGHWTCPLCRHHLRFGDDHQFHQQVLVFNFAHVTERSSSETWWLR
ncbi:putative E3 ubiquitin-protein ligase XERICO [Sesamum alatum]|uniref:E3 ubiquitin-protein ligase XERICO n=1 Tax=Sesamum alatum TaxID=300844 RepID=A0AAE1YHH1_9LAMI|nr:putative E3 ubiquitin-protein ligase XERICO [Sesamum alatum]